MAALETRTLYVEDLVHAMRTGRLRHFRRKVDWDQESVIALLDSVFKGYPIGELLVWAPGDARCAADPWVVVDGQQRLRSIVTPLELAPEAPFDVAFDLDAERFVAASDRLYRTCLPLHLALDTSGLVDFVRALPADSRRASRMDAANRAVNSVRNYPLRVTIVRDSLTHVEEIYRRLDAAGRTRTWDEVESGLTT